MSDSPRYWGSWKGRVIRAISVDKAFKWNEIRDSTGLSPNSLNQVLAELFDAKAITKSDEGNYRVNYELYKEYEKYFNQNDTELKIEKRTKISKDQQSNLVSRIDAWLDFKDIKISLRPRHFYIDGEHLDDLSKDLIKHSQKEVLVVNPFVDRCNLSESLVEASENNIDVRLITRPPDDYNGRHDKKADYHKILGESGINLFYNKIVHAKLIVVDRAVAIVSSMNFYSSSTAGSSWEAGIVSIEDTVVESVMNSIYGLMEKPDSIKQ